MTSDVTTNDKLYIIRDQRMVDLDYYQPYLYFIRSDNGNLERSINKIREGNYREVIADICMRGFEEATGYDFTKVDRGNTYLDVTLGGEVKRTHTGYYLALRTKRGGDGFREYYFTATRSKKQQALFRPESISENRIVRPWSYRMCLLNDFLEERLLSLRSDEYYAVDIH